MTMLLVNNAIKPQTKAWRAFIEVAMPDEKNAIMDLATRLYTDQNVEEGPILFVLAAMTPKDFARKYDLLANNEKAMAVVNRTMRNAGLSFSPPTAKVA